MSQSQARESRVLPVATTQSTSGWGACRQPQPEAVPVPSVEPDIRALREAPHRKDRAMRIDWTGSDRSLFDHG